MSSEMMIPRITVMPVSWPYLGWYFSMIPIMKKKKKHRKMKVVMKYFVVSSFS